MNSSEFLKQINDFEAHYDYDSTYMRELLEYSPQGYKKFNDFMPLASHQEKLDTDSFWIVKLATMKVEDCGECLQLTVRMARENGVSASVIKAVLRGGENLSAEQRDLYDFAKAIASNANVDGDLLAKIETRFDKGSLLEIGLAIAAAKVFPTIKRAIGYIQSCSLFEIKVA